MRIGIPVADAAVQRVIGFAFHTQIPLLTHQKLAGLDDSRIIFCITGGQHGHHAQRGVVIRQSLAWHIDTAIGLSEFQKVIMRFDHPCWSFPRLVRITVVGHQHNGRHGRMIFIGPESTFLLTFL